MYARESQTYRVTSALGMGGENGGRSLLEPVTVLTGPGPPKGMVLLMAKVLKKMRTGGAVGAEICMVSIRRNEQV
jgi:hypothetical protein